MASTWITLQLDSLKIRAYRTREEATTSSLKINEVEPDHPSFHLYEIVERTTAIYRGRLWRGFGEDFRADPWNPK